MFVAVMFSVLMLYLCAGAILCLIKGAQVGGAPYRVMVFGTAITVGVFQSLKVWSDTDVACLSMASTSCQVYSPSTHGIFSS
jgi:hypothetical protein